MTAPSVSISSEIKHCFIRGFNSFRHLKHVHTRLLRFGLDQDNYLINMFLKSTFSFSNQSYARLVFNQTHDPNVFLWNTMIQGFVSKNCFDEARQLFVSMRKRSFLPNNFTLPFVLKACSRLSDYKLGLEVHSLVVKGGFDDDVFVKTGIVCLYSRCGCLEDAHKVFEDIVEKNVVCWTAIISGYIGIKKFKEAIDMFKGLLGMNLRPDSYTLVRVLSACTQLADKVDSTHKKNLAAEEFHSVENPDHYRFEVCDEFLPQNDDESVKQTAMVNQEIASPDDSVRCEAAFSDHSDSEMFSYVPESSLQPVEAPALSSSSIYSVQPTEPVSSVQSELREHSDEALL